MVGQREVAEPCSGIKQDRTSGLSSFCQSEFCAPERMPGARTRPRPTVSRVDTYCSHAEPTETDVSHL